MASPAFFALMLALLAVTAGAAQEGKAIDIWKCCEDREMLSADGKYCVISPWPRNASFQGDRYDDMIPFVQSGWVRRWLPPGLPMQKIESIRIGFVEGFVYSVNVSSLWNSSLLKNEGLFRNTVAFLEGGVYIARPKPGGGFRKAWYCVDAAPPPLGPFAVKFYTWCSEECAYKCCPERELMQKSDGRWDCHWAREGDWTPNKSSLALGPEFPTDTFSFTRPFPRGKNLSHWEVRNALRALHDNGYIHFHFSTWHTCIDFYRSSDGSLHEGLFYDEYPRITRGVYWLLRPLCVLSALLLLASLVSIACDKRLRRKIHGRCLATHAACLLTFNMGQIWYYIAMSERLDKIDKKIIPGDLTSVCKYVALWMYFLLTAAWVWLTALCINMAKGFSLQVQRPKKESGKKFIALSTFAWGLPVLLTITSSFLLAHDIWDWDDVRWYNPSLAESRVCYNEFVVNRYNPTGTLEGAPYLLKSGTALFYFVPVACLVICNIICIARTLRKVQFLKRGNSVLRREWDQIPLGQRHPEGNNFPSSYTAAGHGNKKRNSVDAKTIKLYIKMILMTGVIELLTEIIMWSTTVYEDVGIYSVKDLDLAYRAAGYVTDFFRAAVVTWLAAPEGGYLGLVRRLRRGKGDKKSARAGECVSQDRS